ncbi:MAG: serine/threonine-protein kinase [Deltaproteobacteria bacterium]|nr:serine/threonine-protein kinase [Deltaproteobacteria bacterium]
MHNAEDQTAPSDEVVVDRFALAGHVLAHKYRVDAAIAEGGYGLVYRGEQLTLGRAIALKVLKTPEGLDGSALRIFRETFENEAQTIAKYGHPNIVQVIDFGVSSMPNGEEAPWMVLEWMNGRTLEAMVIARQGPMPMDEVLALVRPIFEALAFVHEAGIVHRDIKPANIMVVEAGRARVCKLMDFGIAKMMNPDESAKSGTGLTQTRSMLTAFSPHYASPEQVSGTRTGPWTDIHAMGLLLTELLTGRMPIEGDDMTELYAQVLSPVRPTPAKYGVHVGAWEEVIQRALAVRPERRFASALDFLEALEAGLSGVRLRPTGEPTPLPVGPNVSPAPPPPAQPGAHYASPAARTQHLGPDAAQAPAIAPALAPTAQPSPLKVVAGVSLGLAVLLAGFAGMWALSSKSPAPQGPPVVNPATSPVVPPATSPVVTAPTVHEPQVPTPPPAITNLVDAAVAAPVTAPVVRTGRRNGTRRHGIAIE